MEEQIFIVTREDLITIFTDWEEECRENPEEVVSLEDYEGEDFATEFADQFIVRLEALQEYNDDYSLVIDLEDEIIH